MEVLINFFFDNFMYIWGFTMISIVGIFLISGIVATKKFDGIDLRKAKFMEKSASGYSKKSFITKMGGASNVLQVYITEEFLITKTYNFFAGIAKVADLLHIIPLDKIQSTSVEKGFLQQQLIIRFENDNNEIQ